MRSVGSALSLLQLVITGLVGGTVLITQVLPLTDTLSLPAVSVLVTVIA